MEKRPGSAEHGRGWMRKTRTASKGLWRENLLLVSCSQTRLCHPGEEACGIARLPLFWKSGNLIVAIRVLHAGPCGIRALLHRVLQELRPSQIIHDEEDSILPVQAFGAASIGTFGKEPLGTLEFLSVPSLLERTFVHFVREHFLIDRAYKDEQGDRHVIGKPHKATLA